MAFLRRVLLASLIVSSAAAVQAQAPPFGHPGGPPPANVAEVSERLRRDPYDLELLVSFGTSKGGSAGHLALALREPGAADDTVHSANFYADRKPEHAERHNAELMLAIPKNEYLFGTISSLSERASFGLDFGEVFKRSVVGIRVQGVPVAERQALAAFFARINADFHARARDTEYHDGEVRYDYLRLNCAKTIGSAFRYGAGYTALEVSSARLLGGRRVVAAANANVPTEMAMKLMKEWSARGYAMDVVLYRKYPASTYVDPHEDKPVAFKDLPNRFPSVLSRDFRMEADAYRDYDNLLAMYLLYNLARYSVRVDAASQGLVIDRVKEALPYARALEVAARDAREDSGRFGRGVRFEPAGRSVEEAAR